MRKSDRLRVNEIFHSLQGEADAVGYPTVFVRLTGCPLRCQYCDTEYAFHAGDWFDLDDIVGKVRGYGAQYVCVTGGEPLAQPNCLKLLERLCDQGFNVSLETSGALDIAAVDARVSRVVDVKTPGSHEAARNRIENFEPPDAARPGEIRDLFPRGLRLEQGVHAGAWLGASNAGFCSRPATTKSRPPRWRTGFWRTVCRCASNCSFTRFCGAMFPASDRRRLERASRGAPSCCSPADWIRPRCWRWLAREASSAMR